MNLKFLKIIVQAVVLEVDDDGNIIGERISEPQPIYTLDQMNQFLNQSGIGSASVPNNGEVEILTDKPMEDSVRS